MFLFLLLLMLLFLSLRSSLVLLLLLFNGSVYCVVAVSSLVLKEEGESILLRVTPHCIRDTISKRISKRTRTWSFAPRPAAHCRSLPSSDFKWLMGAIAAGLGASDFALLLATSWVSLDNLGLILMSFAPPFWWGCHRLSLRCTRYVIRIWCMTNRHMVLLTKCTAAGSFVCHASKCKKCLDTKLLQRTVRLSLGSDNESFRFSAYRRHK